jgi:hypothetical protein
MASLMEASTLAATCSLMFDFGKWRTLKVILKYYHPAHVVMLSGSGKLSVDAGPQ